MSEIRTTNREVIEQMTSMLAASGARQIPRNRYPEWPQSALAYEDEYAIIAIWQFSSFADLSNSWLEAQDEVVRLVGSNVVSTDPKSWDGYLVLVTAEGVAASHSETLTSIRSNTRRLRKLVVTGDDLPTMIGTPLELAAPVRRALAPVLDITIEQSHRRLDPLETIPDRIDLSDEELSDLVVLLDAHKRGIPIVDALFGVRHGCEQENEEDNAT